MSTSIVDVLLDIYKQEGKLTAEIVLDAAVPSDSPLHEYFEWDDVIAAHEYRLVQARSLIRRYDVKILEHRVRRFVFIKSTDNFHPIETAMANRDWRDEIVADFEKDAERFAARWENHKYVAHHYRQWIRAKSSP